MKLAMIPLMIFCLTLASHAKEKPPVQATIQAPIEKVKAITMSRVLVAGFLLDTEGQFQLVFAKNMSDGQSLLVQTLASPPACAAVRPRHILTIGPSTAA